MSLLVYDVGGTRIKWALASANGELGPRGNVATPRTADQLMETLVDLARVHCVTAVRIAVPGIVDGPAGIWRRAANLEVEDLDLRSELARRGLHAAVITNDVAAAATGEAAGGTLALLQLGSGVGARVVVEGKTMNGVHGTAGELGHLVIDPGGRLCPCGLRGCLETVAGWRHIRAALLELGLPPEPQHVFDPRAGALSRDIFDALGVAAATLVAVADPGEIRLGGGMAAAWGPAGADRVAAAMRPLVLEELAASTIVRTSALGDDAALIGLLRLAPD